MEAESKQEAYQSKLATDMHSSYHGDGNGFNVYGGKNYGNGNFTSKRHNGVGNFTFYAKSFEHTSYDDYGGYGRANTRYDNHEHSLYDFAKVEILKQSMIEEFSKVNELPQATIEVEESVALHAKEEISNVEHCDLMRDENLEKESIEIKEKERVEEKERLCIFDSIPIISKDSEHFECSNKKESELQKTHALRSDQNKKVDFVKYTYSKDHNAIDANNKTFGINRFVFGPGR
ncbi:hypothetical protein M9H77_30504 [Catharanthus roseus]|uniref:Uncharacterized protein n=1 Tax=Catharanthus roseus TaxID=4058 RepID=A0ACB9ZYQ7_CATRO|nr:hypothetical protein M9H77_30504 [Catharanthus roseus]